MRMQILDEPVRHNVQFFLEILRRAKQKQIAKLVAPEKVFRAWLNRHTGQLFFAGAKEEPHFTGKKEWRAVAFCYSYDQGTGEISFTLQDAEMGTGGFDWKDIDPSAMRILRDTMKIFSQISRRLTGPSDLDTKISLLSRMRVEAQEPHRERNVLIDTWHDVDRMQAEDLLKGKPLGTWFFRQDDFARILEDQLTEQLGQKIKCFTLTFSAQGGRVGDYTLVHCDGAWQLYDDDPSLKQQSVTDLREILSDHRKELRYPLYRERS